MRRLLGTLISALFLINFHLAQSNFSEDIVNRIHFGDVLEIDVIGSTEYDWKGNLNPEGFIDGLELAEEPIYALCSTEEELAKKIEKAYSKLLRNPQVRVKIVSMENRPIAVVFGAVRNPSRFRLKRLVRLTELIRFVEGLSENASGEIEILRSKNASCSSSSQRLDKSTEIIKIKISDLLTGKEESDPFILPGDIVTVLEAKPVYVIGAVVNPGKIFMRSNMTLAEAIASVGGLTKQSNKKATVFRREKNEVKTIEVDLNKQAESFLIEEYDVIQVSEKGKPTGKIRLEDIEEKKVAVSQLPLKTIE
jgi:protein involved in polysaccharide export with SLBB domain